VDRGLLYVAEEANCRVQVFDLNGNFVRKWGSLGSGDGQFDNPWGIAVLNNSVYVSDWHNNRIQRFDMNGNYLGKWGAWGTEPGRMEFAVDLSAADGLLYVCDSNNNRIQVLRPCPDQPTPALVPSGDGKILSARPMPNPLGRGDFHLCFQADQVIGDVSVDVFSPALNLVRHLEFPGAFPAGWSSVPLDTRGWPGGMLFLRVSAGKGDKQAKVTAKAYVIP
jgi:DNA-binding beta-propeller fold protein YncE